MATATPTKDTIYIDIDDEITGIIDKLRSSDAKIVALVLPKRASVFQSIVNMKLLKRAADDASKHVVLITSENGLLPLAGLAGVLVASSLTSKPAVPLAPSTHDDTEETVDEATGETEITAETAGDKPVGELAGLPVVAVAADEVETIEMDDEAEAPAVAAAEPLKKTKKPKKDQKLSVPNFERFRVLLVVGAVVLIALIVGGVLAATILPKATIAVTTDASNVNANLNFTADSAVNTFNAASHTLPAKLVTQSKTYTQNTPATGQKNNGDKATGQVTVTNCGQDDITIPGGSGISSGGLTFISQNDVVVPASNIVTRHNISSCDNSGHNTINIKAQAGGSNYDLAQGAKYTISGVDNSTLSSVGSAMTGGTDNITKVVSQTDIDTAKSKITTSDDGVKAALSSQLVQAGLFGLTASFVAGTPTVTTSVNAGDAADTVTVNEVVAYTMLGVQQADLKTLVDTSVKQQINTSKQSILDEGLRSASFTVNNSTATSAQFAMQAVAVAGPQLSVDTIKQQAAGKKSGEIQSTLGTNPDVTNVTVKLSPFFVTHVPKKLDKITVTIAKPKVTATSSTNGSKP